MSGTNGADVDDDDAHEARGGEGAPLHGLALEAVVEHIQEVLDLIHEAAGARRYMLQTEAWEAGGEESQPSSSLIRISKRRASWVPAKGTTTPSLPVDITVHHHHQHPHGDLRVLTCRATLCSPLPSQKTGDLFRPQPVELLTVESLTDFLFLHLCVAMVVVRHIGSVAAVLTRSGLLPAEFVDAHLRVCPVELSEEALQHIHTNNNKGKPLRKRVVFYVENRIDAVRVVLVLQPDLSLLMCAPEALLSIPELHQQAKEQRKVGDAVRVVGSTAAASQSFSSSPQALQVFPPCLPEGVPSATVGRSAGGLYEHGARDDSFEDVRECMEHSACFQGDGTLNCARPHPFVEAAISATLNLLVNPIKKKGS
jgi:hypothetical protein